MSLTLFPNAKINLGLLIKGKRADGYHLLETVFIPVPALADTLVLTPDDRIEGCAFSQGGIALDNAPGDNLCVRAYTCLRSYVGSSVGEHGKKLGGVHLALTKHIPAGAGLGGGSSDAAFTLSGLNTVFELGLSVDELAAVAAPLGADVPFFLHNRPVLAKGIGTDFEDIALDFPFEIRLVTSDIHSSTVAAYKQLDYTRCDPARDLRRLLAMPANQWKAHLPNDLEAPVFGLYPMLAEIKAKLYVDGAVYAAMSGSGSAVFGLFPHD